MENMTILNLGNREAIAMLSYMIMLNRFNLDINGDKKLIKKMGISIIK